MEQVVIFRDWQEQQAQDHNDLQAFARTSLDHLVNDAVTASRRYAGFAAAKTTQTEVQVQPGRFYDSTGAVYHRDTVTTQSMVSYLAAAAKRIVTISVYGNETETEVEERDFLVDVTTGRTEPDSVSTVKSRDAVLVFTQGAESADPQPPAIPINQCAIAQVVLDTIQVVSVTMLTDNAVTSTEGLGQRVDVIEEFDLQIGPRVTSLASDLAALANQVKNGAQNLDLVRIMQNLAEVTAKVNFPYNHLDYGADYFLNEDNSDATNALLLGYDALVENGVRFAAANADQFEISLFSANDPNAALQNGLLLPAYTSEVKLTVSDYHDDLGIAQYGYQTYTLMQQKMKVERLRYGGSYAVCSNGVQWQTATGAVAPTWLPDFSTYETVQATGNNGDPWHLITYYDYVWHDSWTEDYWALQTVDHTITGAQVAQSFLVANDTWATRLGFYITSKAANENIIISLCEVTNGMPDLNKCILHQVYDQASIVIGWNRMDIVPTFLSRGKRYAMVFTSNANHRIGMAYGQKYLDGTFFYSTDGAYFLGDLMKDMLFEVWGAKFNASQVTIEFAPINLDGGLRNIDIAAGTVVPDSCQLIYEMRPNGTGDWQPLTVSNVDALNGAPPLCQFRARFVGTRDVQAGLLLTGSRVYVWRPKIAFKHVSKAITLGAASTHIYVRAVLERFDDTPHDLDCKLRISGADVNHTGSVTDEILDPVLKRIARTFYFNPASTTTFEVELIGTSNSPASMFHVAERLHYSATT